MTAQTICQLVVMLGIILTALGGAGAYIYGKREDSEQQRVFDGKLAALQASADKNTHMLFQALDVKKDVWIPVEMNNVPPGIADYLLVLFRSDKGRISGKVRVQGSQTISSFSTSANANNPVAVPNVWSDASQTYKTPTVLEFAVTEKIDPTAGLQILTRGWIDSRGQEPPVR